VGGQSKRPPKKVFVVHGEPDSAEGFAGELRQALGAEVHVPTLGKGFEI
jgi:predicted metal-dependent RNase